MSSLLFFLLSCAYLATEFMGFEARRYPEAIFVLAGFWFLVASSNAIRFSVPVLLMIASVIILTFSWAMMIVDFPDLARSGPALEDYLDKFLFLFVALAIAGSEKRALWLIGGVSACVMLTPWLMSDGFSALARGLAGRREGFGINPIRTAMYFSFTLFVAIAFRRRIVLSSNTLVWGKIILFSLFLIYLVFCLTITQTRAALVSLAFSFVVCIPLFVVVFNISFKKLLTILVGVAAAIMLILVLFSNSRIVENSAQRFLTDSDVVTDVMEGELGALPNSSWGLRVKFIVIGLEKFSERPFSGWGYRGSEVALSQAVADGYLPHEFTQLHNSYLEALVSYGIGGLIIILSLFVWVFYRLYLAWKSGYVPRDFLVFFYLFFAFFAVFILFDGILFQERHGPFLFNVVMGLAVSFIFKHLAEDEVKKVAGH